MGKEALHGEEDRLLKTSEVVKMVGMTRASTFSFDLALIDTKSIPILSASEMTFFILGIYGIIFGA